MNKKLMWFSAFLLSVTITTIAVQYLWGGAVQPLHVVSIALGAVIGWTVITRIDSKQIEPTVDERQRYHVHLSGYWAFLLLNLLVVGALLQPWLARGHLGMWIGILSIGLIFWAGSLLILDQKG